jgi:hypothetical protein
MSAAAILGGMAGMADPDNNIDVEIVETWGRFVRILLGILMLTAAALMALYRGR